MKGKLTRPLLRYHGGKWRIAPWIISHFPPHRMYVEVFGGAGSVLLRKPRSYAEVYNDLDEEIVNVFRVMQEKNTALDLKRKLEFTPFARSEFNQAYEPCDDPVEKARRTVIKSFMGLGSDSITTNKSRTGFRSRNIAPGHFSARNWKTYPAVLKHITERLQGVVIETMDAIDLIDRYDSPDTLFYLDPPYVHETRCSTHKQAYRYEMTRDDHIRLAGVLGNISGAAIISGYMCDLYTELYEGWNYVQKDVIAMAGAQRGSKKAVESLWISPGASMQYSIFGEAV